MFKISDWNELEEFAVDLLKEDSPIRPKNSGGSKKEEDVVGSSLMVQCKHTSNKNITIKDQDLKRLEKISYDLDKLPVFLSANYDSTLLSLSFSNNVELIDSLINLAIILKSIKRLKNEVKYINTLKNLRLAKGELSKKIQLFNNTFHKIKKEISRLEEQYNTRYDDLTMVNLFDEES